MALKGDYIIVSSGDSLCCERHINPELEVVCVKKGPFRVKYENREIVLNDNEATVILPYRIHGFSHGENIDVKIIMFSYSVAEEFYNKYRIKEMRKDIFVIPEDLESYINSELYNVIETKNSFGIKGLFFPLIAEYLKDNESFESANADGSDVRMIIDYISDKVSEGITAEDVAKATGINKTKIATIFKRYLGLSFKEFLMAVRMEKAYNMVLGTDMSITEIAFKCGFGSLRNFNRVFIKMLKCTPRELRKSGMVRPGSK